VYNWL